MPEVDPLVLSYSHLANFPRASEALHSLKKVASLVKPLMRARGWKVGQLVEFYPEQQNLLGLNVDRGRRICLRLRYPGDRNQFLPLEQVADTMLHELAHNVHGPHDDKFHALWNKLRDEHLSLSLKGYTGEGFLSEGHRLGGSGRAIPMDEARRIARAAAERRRALNSGSGQRLGGAAPHPGQDIRKVISDAAARRNRTLRGCANDNQTRDEIVEIADTATRNGFRTQAEEDAANEAAIAQALWEMVQEEEMAKAGASYVAPTPDKTGNNGYNNIVGSSSSTTSAAAAAPSKPPPIPQTSRDAPPRNRDTDMGTWTCEVCTLVNPATYLCCDACGVERSEREKPKRERTVIDLTQTAHTQAKIPARTTARIPPTSSLLSSDPASKKRKPQQEPPVSSRSGSSAAPPRTWTCHFCGRVRESQWWSCDLCGNIKLSS